MEQSPTGSSRLDVGISVAILEIIEESPFFIFQLGIMTVCAALKDLAQIEDALQIASIITTCRLKLVYLVKGHEKN
jgi:hypothetical protein